MLDPNILTTKIHNHSSKFMFSWELANVFFFYLGISSGQRKHHCPLFERE